MRKVLALLFTLSLLLSVAVSLPLHAQDKSRTLKVKLNYTGAGKVDEKHKIFVFLFEEPDYKGEPPFASESVSAKDGTAEFTNLAHSVVYVRVVYDPTGSYDAQSPPPSGAPLGMYSKEPGKAAPVEVKDGQAAQIELTFDDTTKMS